MTNPAVHLGDHGEAFARNLRTVRKASGVEVTELSARMAKRGHRLTADQIVRIEAGQRKASVDDACEISRALGVKLIRLVVPSQLQLVPNRPLHGAFADDKPTRDVVC